MPRTSPRDDVKKILGEIEAETKRMRERTKQIAQEISNRNGTVPPSVVQFLAEQAAEDVPLLERLQEVARMPEKVSMRKFYELIKNDLDYEQSKGVERFLALWETYLQYHTKPPQVPDHWSGVGPVTHALASGGSVVDAVFAKLGA